MFQTLGSIFNLDQIQDKTGEDIAEVGLLVLQYYYCSGRSCCGMKCCML